MKKTKVPVTLIIIASIFILVLYVGISIWAFHKYGNPENAGIFGDTFGAVNALFSGLAFLGVIIAIFLQTQELEAQREELDLTRQEIKEQKEELQRHGATFEFQRFESNYFNLLKTFNGIIDSIVLRKENPIEIKSQGRDCFKNFVKLFQSCYNDTGGQTNLNEKDAIQKAYLKLYNNVMLQTETDFSSSFSKQFLSTVPVLIWFPASRSILAFCSLVFLSSQICLSNPNSRSCGVT